MQLRHMTFRLLEVYVQVVRAGSITQAAEQLHLTQPTVSQQLKRLSEAVGAPLLLNQHGRMHTTAIGQILYELCQHTQLKFDHFGQMVAEQQQGQRGQFSLAMVNTAQYILPRILGPFQQAFPQVEVRVQIGNRQQVLDYFEQQADDLYVFSHPPLAPTAKAARVIYNPLVVIGPAGHPLAAAGPLPMSALLNEQFLVREPGSATRMLFESWLLNQGLLLRRSMQLASNEAICVAVASGLGLAVVSLHVAEALPGGIVVLPVQDFDLHSHWHYVVRQGHELPPAARQFVAFTQEHLGRCVAPEWLAQDIHDLSSRL